jgi:hypothetical protein
MLSNVFFDKGREVECVSENRQFSGATGFLTMQLVDCFEESWAEENQVASVGRLLSKTEGTGSAVLHGTRVPSGL